MNNYSCIDLDVILNNVASYTDILEAKEYILNEDVIFNPLVIKKNNEFTNEALSLIQKEIDVSFKGIKNINDYLNNAKKSITLDGYQLYEILVFHNHIKRIKNELKDIDSDSCLRDYLDSIILHNEVFNSLEEKLEPGGQVKDNASTKLKQINDELLSKQKEINDKASKFINTNSKSLQEQVTYIRENRVTFLVKNQDKNKFNGFTYGSSASGLAYYVEPESFVDINNKIINLLSIRNDEINYILRELSYQISFVVDDYINNFDSIIKLSIVFAKAKYGYENNGIIPEFIDGHNFVFNDLIHPLLDKESAISNTYRLYEPYDGIVISGSNTGGKTVSLKAIGLCIVMSYLGIPITASSAKIPFYRSIFVDIDDNQSIKDSLSTFSSHIKNINYILKTADENSLILIDELISGTDPKQAQAISLAILDKIKELKSKFIITTHFDDIKNYSYKDEHILLSAVGFNNKTLLPTYKYYENSIGSSNALEIASNYLDDKNIIVKANQYLKINQTKQDEFLDKLSKQSLDLENKINEIKKREVEINELEKSYNEKINSFENEKNDLKKKYEEELNDSINEIKNRALNIIDNLTLQNKEGSISQIEELIIEDNDNEDVIFKVGDNVRINDNEQVGFIEDINNDNVTVNINGLKIKTKLKNLNFIPKTTNKKNNYIKPLKKKVSTELNLIGSRVEDGLSILETYLDSANGSRLSKVKIIHGIGTGALRNAIREKLNKLSYVYKFYDGDFYDGGSAVTIVEFKK